MRLASLAFTGWAWTQDPAALRLFRRSDRRYRYGVIADSKVEIARAISAGYSQWRLVDRVPTFPWSETLT